MISSKWGRSASSGPGVPLHRFHFFLDPEEAKGVGYALDNEP